MVRVSGLLQQRKAGVLEPPPDGMTPAEQLQAIRERLLPLLRARRRLLDERPPARARSARHPRRRPRASSTPTQQAALRRRFEDEIFPVLTPLAFDPGHPFPHISNRQHQPRGGGARPRRTARVRARSRCRRTCRACCWCRPRRAPTASRALAMPRAAPTASHACLDRGGGRGQPRPALPGPRDRRLLPVPRHARRRLRDRGGRGRRPADRDGGGGRAAPLRLGRPPRDRQRDAGAHPRHPDREPRARSRTRSTPPRARSGSPT